MLEPNIKIDKEKKILYFSSSNWYGQMIKMQTAFINSYRIYGLIFFIFLFVSLKATSLLLILKLIMGNFRALHIAFLNIVDRVSLYF